jgi:hypothetical protein
MFSIGIPTLNRADLLNPSLQKYQRDFKGIDIHIIDNGQQELLKTENTHIHKEDFNLGVAASWNKLCRIIFQKNDWALLINDDIYLGYTPNTVNAAILKSRVGIVQSAFNWSVILISKKLYEKVGEFDETFFPAYYEDSDYMYRLQMLRLRHEVDLSLNPLVVLQSQTYYKAPELVNKAMKENRLRYIEKWGNSPLLEIFKTPYNK